MKKLAIDDKIHSSLMLISPKALLGIVLLPLFMAVWGRYGLKFSLAVVVSWSTGLLVWFLRDVFTDSENNRFYWPLFVLFPLFIPLGLPLWIIPVNLLLAYFISISSFGGSGRHLFNPIVVCLVMLVCGYSSSASLTISRPFAAASEGFEIWTAGVTPSQSAFELYSSLTFTRLFPAAIKGNLPSIPGSAFPVFILALSFLYAIFTRRALVWWVSSVVALTLSAWLFNGGMTQHFTALHPLIAGVVPSLLLVAVVDAGTLPDSTIGQIASATLFASLVMLFWATSSQVLAPAFALLVAQIFFAPANALKGLSNAT